ncbi:MAG: MGMT family protein [Parcubacteria group bacterium]|jgi:O-6-methylguanine DNA methyltransferase
MEKAKPTIRTRNKKPPREGAFYKKVIGVVSKIKRGETLTYKEVAKKSGNEKAARSVGRILSGYYLYCEKNDIKKIPCHRVIRSDGKAGGYVKGAKEKARLLKKEKAISR